MLDFLPSAIDNTESIPNLLLCYHSPNNEFHLWSTSFLF